LNSALNPNIVQSIRTAKRQCHATRQKSSPYSDHLAVIRVFLATRRGPREIDRDLERFPIRSSVRYVLPITAVTSYVSVCRNDTRNRRGDFPPAAQLPPEEASANENNARRSSVQNNSLSPPGRRRHFKPIELPKTFAAGAEMIEPRINFRNRDLVARHAVQKR
jgi:hypothetical protein